jgi:hypothetical protein
VELACTLPSLEDLLEESLDPRGFRERFGLPHPLSKFAPNGDVKDGPYADIVLMFTHDLTCAEPGSPQYEAAKWFLFESEKAFFFACSKSGIDADKFRSHLLSQQFGAEDVEFDGGEPN